MSAASPDGLSPRQAVAFRLLLDVPHPAQVATRMHCAQATIAMHSRMASARLGLLEV
jgi:hypothetical protein